MMKLGRCERRNEIGAVGRFTKRFNELMNKHSLMHDCESLSLMGEYRQSYEVSHIDSGETKRGISLMEWGHF